MDADHDRKYYAITARGTKALAEQQLRDTTVRIEGGASRGDTRELTIMFCDIRGFTSMAEKLQPEQTIELLNTYYTLMFDAISGHGGVVNQIM